MERIATTTSFHDFGRWTPSWLGLATNQRMEKYLARLTSATNFEDLDNAAGDRGNGHQCGDHYLLHARSDLSAAPRIVRLSGVIRPDSV